MLELTVGPHFLTESNPSLVLTCSRIILNFGNAACNFCSCGRNIGSAFKIVTAVALVLLEGNEAGGVLVISPCRLRTISWVSMAEKTG